MDIHELAQELGVGRTAAKHHARALIRRGQVVTVRQGRHLFHFLASLAPLQRTALTLLRLRSFRVVVTELFDDGTASWEQIASRHDLSIRSVRRVVHRLRKLGLLQITEGSRGSRRVVHLHPTLRLVLVRWVVSDGPGMHRLPTVSPEGMWFYGSLMALVKLFAGA